VPDRLEQQRDRDRRRDREHRAALVPHERLATWPELMGRRYRRVRH
jgi:hypothetical protein